MRCFFKETSQYVVLAGAIGFIKLANQDKGETITKADKRSQIIKAKSSKSDHHRDEIMELGS